MSIKIMSQIWEREDLDPYERLVLLSLADHANDEGACYPSVGRLCTRTGMKERGVQTVVKRLCEKGFITVLRQAGKKGANVYQVHPNPRTPCTPHQMHPPHDVRPTPAPHAPQPPHGVHPNHHSTVNEPSEEPPLVPPAAKPSEKARLPEDWALSDEGWAYARSQQIPDEVIRDEATGFHAYWSDRRDRDASKSRRGWEQCWATRCRLIASRYVRGRGVAGQAAPAGYGRGSSLASVVARRRAEGQV